MSSSKPTSKPSNSRSRKQKNPSEERPAKKHPSNHSNVKATKVRTRKKKRVVEPSEPWTQQLQKWFDVKKGDNQIPDPELRPEAFERVKLFGKLMAAGFAGLFLRAGYLMLIPNAELEDYITDLIHDTEIIRGRRGDILDRNGNILATTVALEKIILSPKHIDDEFIPLVSELLARHFDLNAKELEQRIRSKKSKHSQYLVVKERVTPKAYEKLREELKDIYNNGDRNFQKAFKLVKNRAIDHESASYRYYTGKSEAAPLLGGIRDFDQVGAGGLEIQYDQQLRGNEFATIRVRDGRNRDLAQLTPDQMAPQAQDGNSLILTLDRRIQHVTDVALAKAVESTGASNGIAVVVDVKTGEILASSTQPTANINEKSTYAQLGLLTHHAFIDSYEAGSVLKPLIAAAAINEGLYSPYTEIDCKGGYWRIHGANIRDDHPKDILTVTGVIQHSSNIGAAQMMLALGPDKAVDYLQDFGLGQKSGLNFPAEPTGILRSANKLKPIELITMSYGYGLTSTLTQLAMAYAALGNDGKLMKPLLVKEILNANGETIERFEPTQIQEVVSEKVADQMMEMMQVVVEDGTAKNARVPGFKVAGKTGTAKKAVAGSYSTTDRIGSFIGVIPADDPVIAIAISIDTPTVGWAYGGVVAAPAFAEIAEESMKILGVAPNPDLMEKIEEKPMVYAAPPPMPELIWTEKGEIIIPDLTGLTLRDALSALQVANLNIEFEGSGTIQQQIPVAGSLLHPKDSLKMVLQ